MDNLLSIRLEAHHEGRNHHRWYEITVGRDLLDDWTVIIRYGRAGRNGQERRFGGPDVDGMRCVVREHLRRRESAPRRIGCAYRLIAVNAMIGVDADAWLPMEWRSISLR